MKTIFLADNETHVRNAIRLVLEQQGSFEIIGEAEHAEGLLAEVCQNPPELVLLDWDLPGVHYPRLINTIKQHCPKTYVVIMSVKPEPAHKAQAYGADGFISKHLVPEKFIQQLTEYFTNPSTLSN